MGPMIEHRRSLHARCAQVGVALLLFACPALTQGHFGRPLGRWLEQQRTATGPLSSEQLTEGNELVDRISANWPQNSETKKNYTSSLLRMTGRARLRAWSGLSAERGGDREATLATRAQAALRLRIDDSLLHHLESEVLLLPRLHSEDLRAGAALLLGDIDSEHATLALLAATRDPERHVRECAVESLVGRDSPAVHRAILGLLREVERADLELTTLPLERHFQGVLLRPDSPAEELLFQFVRERLPSSDWHIASRAIER